MSFNVYNYYKEIRNRFITAILNWSFCLCVCYSYKETILFTLVHLNYSLTNFNAKPYFIFTEVTEIFNVYIELSLFIANQIGIIFLIYQIFMFFASGLYKFEYQKITFALKIFAISWLSSTILLYILIIPFSWNFFLGFQSSSNAMQPFEIFFETSLINYFHYFISIYYLSVINCQFLGFLTVILTSLNERFRQSRTFRKLFYLIFVIFSTIITPPDVISQIFISLSLIITYELLLLVEFVNINRVAN